jgi:hypothetical protein
VPIPETSACDCVKAFGHVLYKKYEKNTNNKKNTKILERNTKRFCLDFSVFVFCLFVFLFFYLFYSCVFILGNDK